MQDSNLILLNQAVTATVTGSWFDLGKGGVAFGLDVEIVIPQATGTSPVLGIAFDFGDDGSTAADTYTVVESGTAGAGLVGTLFKRLRTRHRYVRPVLTVGGTTPNFGTVTIQGSSGLSYRDANIPNS